MTELLHRVRVFVYRFDSGEPQYLLLRAPTGIEACWTPLHAPLGFGEQLESAIRRGVIEDTGLGRPNHLIDLDMTSRTLFGDEEVIEWNYGLLPSGSTDAVNLREERWSEFRWEGFGNAYPKLEFETDRAAILRLHTMLHAG
ncbi:MAG: hypothetical protein WD226_12305 [Planctomycetota bacterium]